MRRFLLGAALTAILAAGAAATAPTQATPLPQATTCSGVWVVVDYGSLGGTSTKCATSYGTGTKALRSAGFSVVADGGFVLKVNGKPGNPDTNTEYWSYWHATKAGDGTYSDWNYSSLGADAYHPTRGNAEGWRYQKLSDGKVPPGASPPVTPATTPTPKPTRTSSKQSTTKPSKTATKTASATTTATKSATTKKTATATDSASASATPAATTASQTPSATVAGTDATPFGADQVTEAPPDPGGGSPVGLIVASVAVVLAGGGLGGWWLWRGRRP